LDDSVTEPVTLATVLRIAVTAVIANIAVGNGPIFAAITNSLKRTGRDRQVVQDKSVSAQDALERNSAQE
jgi:hypothetical protein